MHVFSALFLLLSVLAAEILRDDVVSGAMNQPLRRRMVNRELHGISFVIMLRHLARFASKKIHDRVVAEVLFPRLLQIHYACQ